MSDLISRQAAITALSHMCSEDEKGITVSRANVDSMLRYLPSAQPEQRWIPCSDENPKADGRYLITGKMGTVYSLDFEDGRWYGGIKPVAWMPLPEPYKAESEGKE